MREKTMKVIAQAVDKLAKETREATLRDILTEVARKRNFLDRILNSEESQHIIMTCRSEKLNDYFDKRAWLRAKSQAYAQITSIILEKIYNNL